MGRPAGRNRSSKEPPPRPAGLRQAADDRRRGEELEELARAARPPEVVQGRQVAAAQRERHLGGGMCRGGASRGAGPARVVR